jgi:hypothetical protein
MLPLWDVNTKNIIIQRDTEPFKDAGYDKKFSWEPYNRKLRTLLPLSFLLIARRKKI